VSKSLSNGELIDGRFLKKKRAARFLGHVANHLANQVTAKKLDANYSYVTWRAMSVRP